MGQDGGSGGTELSGKGTLATEPDAPQEILSSGGALELFLH